MVASLYAANMRLRGGGGGPTAFVVFDADGNSFNAPFAVFDSDGNSFTVPTTVLNAAGSSFAVATA
jgi:hypothetical protein